MDEHWSFEESFSHTILVINAKTNESGRMWNMGWFDTDMEFSLEERDVRVGKGYVEGVVDSVTGKDQYDKTFWCYHGSG